MKVQPQFDYQTSIALKCQLCDREMENLTIHHLVPKQAVKRKKADPGPTVEICSACHRQIHTLFNNAELAKYFNSSKIL
jgi:HNH endonuclease